MEKLMVFIPLTLLIVSAVLTKKIAGSLLLAVFSGVLLVYRESFLSGFIDTIYHALSNSSYQFVLILMVSFGGMIKLLQESGGLAGFGNLVAKYANGPKKPLLLAWLMTFILFVDDYLSTLSVSFTMREITDRNGIPREHLAYQINVMASCLCILIPFSSWAAFTAGLLRKEELAYGDYVSAIPYMLYPLFTVLLCLLVILGLVPKAGGLKKAYDRVASGGPVFQAEAQGRSLVEIHPPKNDNATSPLNAILPMAALIIAVFLSGNSLIHGLLVAMTVQGFLYISQKIMRLGEFIDYFFQGAASMFNLCMVGCFAYMLTDIHEKLGFFEIVIGGISSTVPPWLLPALIFITIGLITFASAGVWAIQVISIPIFIPLAFAMNIDPIPLIAAMMSGVAFGCNLCFYADTILIAGAGTGLSNMTIIRVSSPYCIAAGILTTAGYLILGVIMI